MGSYYDYLIIDEDVEDVEITEEDILRVAEKLGITGTLDAVVKEVEGKYTQRIA